MNYSVDVKNKAAIIASVIGGDSKDYFEVVSMMPADSVEDLIMTILAEKDVSNANFAPKKREEEIKFEEEIPKKEEKVEKKEVKVEKKEVKFEKKEEKEVVVEQERKFKKSFSNIVKQKSEKVAEVIGGKPEDYYGVCDAFCFSTVNDLVEMVFSDPAVTIKYSSYASN